MYRVGRKSPATATGLNFGRILLLRLFGKTRSAGSAKCKHGALMPQSRAWARRQCLRRPGGCTERNKSQGEGIIRPRLAKELSRLGPRPPINVRSVTLGMLGVVVICGATPYNDYALNNTFLVGNNLPIGVVMLLFLFALLVTGR